MNTEPVNKCGLKREDFQTTVQGKKTDLFVLRNNQGNEVAVTNYGGAVVAIMMPDKDGNYANLVQGHDNIQDVINSPEPFLSVLIGRYGNRIKEGKFTLHGKEYQLACNDGNRSPLALGVYRILSYSVPKRLRLPKHEGEAGIRGKVPHTVVSASDRDSRQCSQVPCRYHVPRREEGLLPHGRGY